MRIHLLVTLGSITTLSACGGAIADEPAFVEVGIGSTSSALQGDVPTAAPEEAGARHLRLHVSEIRVHVAGGGDGRGKPDEDDARGGWLTVFSGERVVQLTDRSPVQEVLGSANARPGRITQIRLLLASPPELVDGATRSELECGSCEQSGLKIVPAGNLALDPGGRHHVTIGFDVDRSIVDAGGTLRLVPVMRLDSAP